MWTTVNGVHIGYTDTGRPAGRPGAATVVFGHGLLFGGWMFRAQIDVLRRDYRCVTVDWRGQGSTPPTDSGYDMDSLSADALGLIERLALGPVHYVGLSMGGFVGLRLAVRHGARLRSLTLLDTSADAEDARLARRLRGLAAGYRLFGLAPVRRPAAKLLFGQTFRRSARGPEVVAEWARRLRRGDRRGVSVAARAVANRASVTEELSRIRVPTLLVTGAEDVVTPQWRARCMADRIAGARLEIVEAAGHSSVLEQPDRVNALLADFLQSVDNG